MYHIFEQLLQKNNISQYRVAKETGVSQPTLSAWKNGTYTPKRDKLQKIADYFNVSIEYLLGETDISKENTIKIKDEHDNIIVLDDETLEIIDSLRSRPDMKMLFSVSKKATPEDIIQAVKIIEALKKDSE